MTDRKVGFIGAGRMGGAVARRLATGGFGVRVFDPDATAVDRCVRAGATAASSAVDAAAGADVVLTSLPLPEDVLATWQDLATRLGSGTIGVDLSTIDPDTARAVTDLLAGHGVHFVSCTLGKTPMAAESGEIPLFVGGPPDAVGALRPLLARIGEKVYDFATPEAATMFKLISNMVGMTHVAVLAEAYVLARRAGIAQEMFAAALDDTGARSFQSDVRLPWLIAGDYAARFGVRLAAKDVRLAVDAAARWGVPTPVAAQGLAQLVAAIAHGHGDQDAIAVAKVIDPSGALVPHDAEGSPDDVTTGWMS
jgi:3-hydroxyisobutyrate dehydrogenase